jgi:autotransporter-associated beta strand protein
MITWVGHGSATCANLPVAGNFLENYFPVFASTYALSLGLARFHLEDPVMPAESRRSRWSNWLGLWKSRKPGLPKEKRRPKRFAPRIETLEDRLVPTWIGATTGATLDTAHNYNLPTNWKNGTIDDSFSGVTLTGNLTLYMTADRLTASNLNLNYAGSYDFTLKSSSTTARNLTLQGDVNCPNNRSITIGDATNPVNVSLGSATRSLGLNGTSLTFVNVISGASNAGLTSAGSSGTLELDGTNTYTGPTTIGSGTELTISQDRNLGAVPTSAQAGWLTINGGTLLATSPFALNSNRGMTLSANATIDVGSGTLSYSGIVAGSGKLVKTDAGTLSLRGANTYSGGTTISGGTVQIGNGGATGSLGSGNIGNDGSLDFDLTSTITVASTISGTGSLTQAGSGTLILTGANTYSGGTTISAGTLQVGSGGATGSLGSGNITDNTSLVYDLSSTTSVASGIKGTGSLTQAGSGTLTLTGTKTYSGGTILQGGELSISSDGNLGAATGGLTFNGGLLQVTGTAYTAIPTARSFVWGPNGGGFDIANSGNTFTLSQTLSGTGGLTKTGPGTLILTATNTNSGSTTISGGTLQIGADACLGTAPSTAQAGSLVLDGGTLATTADLTLSSTRGITFGTGGGTIDVASGTTLTYNGVAAGAGGLTDIDSGMLSLGGASTYQGATTVSGGTLRLGAANALPKTTALTVSGSTGSFGLHGFNQEVASLAGDGTVQNGVGAVTLTVSGSANTTFSGTLSQALGLARTGSGILTLSGNNTYTGGTIISGNSGLSVSADTDLGKIPTTFNSASLTLDGGALNYTGSFTLNSNRGITLGTGGGVFSAVPSATLTYNGIVTGPGTLSKTGDGTLVLGGANTYQGSTLAYGGMLQIAAESALGAVPTSATPGSLLLGYGGTLAAMGSFTLNSKRGIDMHSGTGTIDVAAGCTLTYAGIASGPGSLSKTDAGTLVLSGANTYQGATTVSGGTLQVGVANVLPTSAALIVNSPGVVDLNGFDRELDSLAGDGTVTTGAAATLTVSGSDTTTFAGIMSGPLNLVRAGTGALFLTGVNTYQGTTTVNSGLLASDADNSVPANTALTVNGTGTFLVGSFDQWVGSLNGSGTVTGPNGTLTVNGSGTSNFSGTLSGGLGLGERGSGTLILSGNNSYTGVTIVYGGTLKIGATNAIPLRTSTNVASGTLELNTGTTFDLNGFSQQLALLENLNQITWGGTVTNSGSSLQALTLGADNLDETFAGTLSGALALVKVGSGSLTLSGSNSYIGGTEVSDGTLRAGVVDVVPLASVLIVDANGVFDLFGYDQHLGSVDVVGTVTNTSTTVTPTLSIFGGVISGALTGPLNLSKVGGLHDRLTLSGNDTYTGTTTISAGTLQIGAGGTTGSLGTGAVTNNGSLIFDLSSNPTLANVISGSGSLTQLGSGTLTLSGASSYTGGTVISQGTLKLDNVTAAGSGCITLGDANSGTNAVTLSADVAGGTFTNPVIVSNNGTGTATIRGDQDGLKYAGAITINRDTTLDGNSSNGYGLSGSLTGTRTLYINAPLLTLDQTSGSLSFTGSVIINTGKVLQLDTPYDLSGNNDVTANGTLRLTVGGNTVTIGALGGDSGGRVEGKATLALGADGHFATFGGVIADNQTNSGGILAITKVGTGTETFSNFTNTYTGVTTISGGALSVPYFATFGGLPSCLGAASSNPSNVVLNGGTLIFTGQNQNPSVERGMTVDSTHGGTLEIDDPASGLWISGQIVGSSGNATLTKTGAGTLILTGHQDNSFLALVASEGKVILREIGSSANVHAVGNGGVTVKNGAVVQLGLDTDSISFLGGDQIADGAPVTIESGGVLDVHGESETINTLTINGAGSGSGALVNGLSGTSATLTVAAGVTIDSDSTVGGDGNLGLPNGINDGINGPAALVKSGAGTLTLSGTSSYTGTTTVVAGNLVVNGDVSSSANGPLGHSSSAVVVGDTSGSASAALYLAGANTFSRPITIQAGSSGSATVGSQNTSQQAHFTGSLALNKNVVLSNSSGGEVQFTGGFSGTGMFTTSGHVTVKPLVTVVTCPATTAFGQSVTLTATVSAPTNISPTGTVTFLEGTTTLGTATLSSGSAKLCTSALPTGTDTITATYNGDNNFLKSCGSTNQTVTAAASETTVAASPATIVSGQGTTLTATVSSVLSNGGTPAGTVTFYDGTTTLGTTNLSNGTASLSITGLNLGSHTITGVFTDSDGSFSGSISTGVSVIVSQASTTTSLSSLVNPSRYGQTVITATVAPVAPGGGVPTGTVTFSIDGGAGITVNLDNTGSAALPGVNMVVGTHAVTASYSGDKNFIASSTTSSLSETVVQATTTTSPVVASSTSVFGQTVTLTATIAVVAPGAGVPTGTVNFEDNGTVFASAPLSNNTASVTTTTLSIGVHTLTAVYSGDANFVTSSGSNSVTVSQADTSTSVTGPATSTAGQSITFTAKVGAAAPGSGTPTGTVTFQVDGVDVTTATLDSSGAATYATADLGVGSHTITANYSGNSNFNVSSGTWSLTVTQLADNAAPYAFDFASIGGAGQTATVSLVNGGLTLQIASGGTVVATEPLNEITRLDFTGRGNDLLTLDFTTPFALPISFTGAAGDALQVVGGNLTGKYVPAAGSSDAGSLQVGTDPGSSIAFTGLSALTVSALSAFSFITPGGSDNITIDSPAAGVNRIVGTSAGTAFVPVTFGGVRSVSVDTGANDSGAFDDTIMIPSGGLVATGLQSLALTTGSGNDMLLDYAPNYSLPVPGGTLAFDGGAGSNTLVGPSTSIASAPVLTHVDQSIPVPVIVLPGLTASFLKPAYTADFFSEIGTPQSEWELEPLKNTYADLVQTLENVGYQEGLTLFESPYDWRLPVAPQDGNIDGSLSNLSVAELTGGVNHYMVDYFGTALVTAAQAWAAAFDGRALPAVNVITHSTGGLIARSYVQSPAYGQAFAPGQYLPKINDAVMMAPPNQGDSETWNYLHDDFGNSFESRVMDLIVSLSYNAVAYHGQTITSPNGDINLNSILVDGLPSIQKFFTLYFPALKDLQASYPFVDSGSGSLSVGSPAERNNFLLDLNDGLGLNYTSDNIPAGADPNSFLHSATNSFLGNVYVEYSSTENTLYQADQEPAGTGTVVPLGTIFSLPATTTWYQDVRGSQNGDATLTTLSTIGQFSQADPKVVLQKLTTDSDGKPTVIHAKIPSYSTALAEMLSDLDQPNSSTLISQGLSTSNTSELAQRALSLVPYASFSWFGLTFDASQLQLSYNPDTDVYDLTGPSSLTIPNVGTIDVTLGGGTTHGLVLTGTEFTSLDMTVTSDLTIGGLDIKSDALTLSYQKLTDTFAMTGTAECSLEGNTVQVTLGGAGNSGLVVHDGALSSLDMTIDSNIAIGGVTFNTTGLDFTYNAALSQYTLTGSAGVSLGNVNNLTVSFGGNSTHGLVVTNGSLTSLDVSITSNFAVGGVTFNTTGLEMTYVAATSEYTVSGTAGVNVTGISNFSVTFGYLESSGLESPGLVIQNGALQSLDMTVNSDIQVSAVNFSTDGLRFTYTVAGSLFTLAGTAGVSVTGISNLSVTFGHGLNPGLVIQNGKLDSLDLTVNSDISVGAVGFQTTGLEFTYTTAGDLFTLDGTADVTVSGIGNFSVTFGHGSNHGLVIHSSKLVSLDMTVNSDISVGAIDFQTTGLEFTYTTSSSLFTLAGTAGVSVTGISNLNVTFGHGSNPGLVIQSGALVSLDMTVNSNINVGAVTFQTTGLEFTYTTSSSVFTLAGTAGVTVSGIGNFSVTFGHGSNPGLVIQSGKLVSLDMTVNSDVSVGAVTFQTSGLEFTYTTSSSVFTLAGTAALTVTGIGNFSITFGHGSNPGLVIQNGNLVSLDMTVNSDISVGAVGFHTTGLEFTYTTASSVFTLAGTAGVTVSGIGNFSVTFGHGSNPGLVIQDGELVSLDMTVNSDIDVGAIDFQTTGLEFTYTTSSSLFTLAGTAGVTVTGIGNLFVTFGHGSNPGLVIQNGKLVSLDMTVNSDIQIGSVDFNCQNLEFTYTVSSSLFTLAGEAGVSVAGIGNLDVTFGYQGSPGLVIQNGNLVSLDMTVDSNIQVGSVDFTTEGLEFTYTVSSGLFTLAGTAGVSVMGIGNLNVTFGNHGNPGLVIHNGNLVSLDMTVDSDIQVGSVDFSTQGLEFTYTVSSDLFTLSGTAGVTVGGINEFFVTFGNQGNPGLVIQDGDLVTLDMTVNSSITVGTVNFSTQGLEFKYVVATDLFTLSGTAGVTLADTGNFSVTFGYGSNPGLVLQNGSLQKLDMTVNSTITVSTMVFSLNNMEFVYTPSTSTFTMTGSASVTVITVGTLGVSFGGGSTRGLVIVNGTLQSLDMVVNSNFIVGGAFFQVNNMTLTYSKSHAIYTVTGSASVSEGLMTYTATLGGSGSQGLVIKNGSLLSLDATLSTTLGVPGFSIGSLSLNMQYQAPTSSHGTIYSFGGTADLTLTVSLPSDVATFLGIPQVGWHVGSLGFNVYDAVGNNSASYCQVYVSVAGVNLGLKVDFTGKLTATINGKDASSYVESQLASPAKKLWKAISGYLDGASVYFDANRNGTLDPGEPTAVTGPDGSFAIDMSNYPDLSAGQFVVTGGTDTSTGLPNTAVITAPGYALIISPLTSLVNQVLDSGVAPDQANTLVAQSLGLDPSFNLSFTDPIQPALAGDAAAAQVFTEEVKVSNLIYQLDGLLNGSSGTTSTTSSNDTFASLADQMEAADGAPLDLTSSATMQQLIDQTSDLAGVSVDAGVSAGAAGILAGVNTLIDSLNVSGTATSLNQLLQVQVVAEGTVAGELAQAGSGSIDINDVVNQTTPSALQEQAEQAPIGVLPIASVTGVAAGSGTYGADTAVTVTVTSLGGGLPGMVVLTIDRGATLSQTLAGDGTATFMVNGISAGDHTLHAEYEPASSSYFGSSADGALHIDRRALTITAADISKVYDGTTAATASFSDDRVVGDDLHISYTDAAFTDKNVGTGKAVTISGITISGASASNYSFDTTLSATGDITPRLLTVSATGQNKVYDAGVVASVTLSDNRVAGDVFTDSYTSAAFADKNAGAGKQVNVSGIAITGSDAGNYAVNTMASTVATITPFALTISATGQDRIYDGITADGVSLADNRFAGDGLTDSYSSASFADKNAGSAKPVSVSGIFISGTDAGNYTFNTSASTSATISPRSLTASLIGTPTKSYDGNATARLTQANFSLGNLVSGEGFTVTQAAGSYNSVHVTDVSTVTANLSSGNFTPVSGTLSSNYILPTSASGAGRIQAAAFTYQIANDSQLFGYAANLALDLGSTVNTGVHGENLAIAYSSPGDIATAPSGTYPISGVLSDGTGRLSDYNPTLIAGTLSVAAGARSAYILNTHASGAVTATGNASVILPGGLYVDSDSPTAIVANGHAQVNSGYAVQVVGGVSQSGSAQVTKTGTPAGTADPLAALALPSPAGLTNYGAVNVSGTSSLTLNPGIYSSIQVSGHGSVTLNPGWYLLEGGGLSVSGNASLRGDGILIFNGGSSYNGVTDGGVYGSLSLGGNGTISLSAATSGPYSGVLIFQSRGNTRAISLGGNSVAGLTGTIYAAAAAVGLSGNAQMTGSIVASTLSVTGNAGAFQLSSGSSSDYAASTSNWIADGILTVAAQDDTGNGIDPNELHQIGEAMAYLNDALAAFGVNLSWATDGSSADVHIHFASTTPQGGAAEGVLGFTTETNDVYLASGWSFYTGDDPTGIGAGQYDFLTLAIHELAHTVGLGESCDPASVMNQYLDAGAVHRAFTDSNLALINTNADRFMKAANHSMAMPAPSESLFTSLNFSELSAGQLPALGGTGSGREQFGPVETVPDSQPTAWQAGGTPTRSRFGKATSEDRAETALPWYISGMSEHVVRDSVFAVLADSDGQIDLACLLGRAR